MSEGSAPIVGIDLGTTNSAITVFQDGRARLIENELGEQLTPSAVAYDARAGGVVVGRIAKDLLARNPALGTLSFKRHMGTEQTLKVNGEAWTPEQLSSYVLDSLRTDAERFLGRSVERCVVSVPAYFSEAARFATRRAAEMAGLVVERVVNEPTAAALAYGMHDAENEKRFLVFDLGGGTFDVCVMEIFEGMLEVKSVAGVSQLGGDDFTTALMTRALSLAGLVHDDPAVTAESRAALLKRAEIAKRKLSKWPVVTVEMPEWAGEPARSVELTQEIARDAYGPLLDRFVRPCREVLRSGGIGVSDIDEVLLVGGATKMPLVANLAAELFDREPKTLDDPELAVAKGSAIQAALYADDASLQDLVVTDVLSHSLGVGVVREIGGKLIDGYFSPVIHRNTVIPTSRTEEFETVMDNQRQLHFEVYEGESRKSRENDLLGTLTIKDLPKSPSGLQVAVTFTYDISGILEVTARLPGTDNVTREVFVRNRALGEQAIEQAIKRIQQLKADPRERPKYRDLLGRAELLWAESPPELRDRIALVLDQFESSLASANPSAMERSYEVLREVCNRYDGGERW
ncbi:MAG: Hsp70 family protein [Myxococcota bacterium]